MAYASFLNNEHPQCHSLWSLNVSGQNANLTASTVAGLYQYRPRRTIRTGCVWLDGRF